MSSEVIAKGEGWSVRPHSTQPGWHSVDYDDGPTSVVPGHCVDRIMQALRAIKRAQRPVRWAVKITPVSAVFGVEWLYTEGVRTSTKDQRRLFSKRERALAALWAYRADGYAGTARLVRVRG
jgi:hypothetical protein